MYLNVWVSHSEMQDEEDKWMKQSTKCKNSDPLTLAFFCTFFLPPGGKGDKPGHKYRLQYKQNGLSTIMSLAEALSTETPT